MIVTVTTTKAIITIICLFSAVIKEHNNRVIMMVEVLGIASRENNLMA